MLTATIAIAYLDTRDSERFERECIELAGKLQCSRMEARNRALYWCEYIGNLRKMEERRQKRRKRR